MGGSIAKKVLDELDHDNSGCLDRTKLRQLIASVDPRNKQIGSLFCDVKTLLQRGGGHSTLTEDQLKQAMGNLTETQGQQLLHFVRRYKEERRQKGHGIPEIWVFEKNTQHRKDHYKILEKIGAVSGFAEVYRVKSNDEAEKKRKSLCRTNKPTGEMVKVVKKIDKLAMYRRGTLEDITREIKILAKCHRHPNVVALYDYFEDRDHVYIVMEALNGGELFDRMGSFVENEEAAARVMAQVLQAICYLHSNGVAHCDIKPENFLFREQERRIGPTECMPLTLQQFRTTYRDTWEKEWALALKDPESYAQSQELVLIDFGISQRTKLKIQKISAAAAAAAATDTTDTTDLKNQNKGKRRRTSASLSTSSLSSSSSFRVRMRSQSVYSQRRGTVYYIAPEVLKGKYTYHCDCWSAGIMLFEMLYGYPPFDYDNDAADDDNAVFEKIRMGFQPIEKEGKGPWFNSNVSISKEAKELIKFLLESDPMKRLSASEALLSPWFRSTEEAQVCRKKMIEKAINEVRNMKSFRRFMLSLVAEGHYQALGPLSSFAAAVYDRKDNRSTTTTATPDLKKNGNNNNNDNDDDICDKMEKHHSDEPTLSAEDVLTILGGGGETWKGRVPRKKNEKFSSSSSFLATSSSYRGGETSSSNTNSSSKYSSPSSSVRISLSELKLVLANCMVVAKEERLHYLFNMLDTSGDKKIDRNEFFSLLKKNKGFLTEGEMEEIFTNIDADDDNMVDYSEFLHAFGIRSLKDMLRPVSSTSITSMHPSSHTTQTVPSHRPRRSSCRRWSITSNGSGIHHRKDDSARSMSRSPSRGRGVSSPYVISPQRPKAVSSQSGVPLDVTTMKGMTEVPISNDTGGAQICDTRCQKMLCRMS
mmetsp:Transcript_39006/g.63506  ORF Transcript_39006/g.63506 Transcript_39006/m.63506 type:complete len:872 (+) Transcript_39006:202-2817(+)